MSELFHVPRVGWKALAVWRRNGRVWLKGAVWSSLLGELFEPILYLYGLGYGLGGFIPQIEGQSYLAYVAPGLLVMGALWGASFENTYGSFTRMERQKIYAAIIVTPVTLEEVVAGEIFWGATKASVGGFMMLAVAAVMGLGVFPQALLCLPLAFFAGLVFASMALAVTAFSHNYEFFAYYFNVILMPLFFLSGTWFPVDTLPQALQWAAEVSPLTHAVRMSRALLGGDLGPGLLPSLAWLALYGFVFFTLSANLIRRRLIQ